MPDSIVFLLQLFTLVALCTEKSFVAANEQLQFCGSVLLDLSEYEFIHEDYIWPENNTFYPAATQNNSHSNDSSNDDDSSELLYSPSWTQVVIPIISVAGILGNVLSLFVLSSKARHSCSGGLERAANAGLTALAVSDLSFCMSVLPHAFISNHDLHSATSSKLFAIYYRVYGLYFINTFLMISTWLVVVLAVERYIVLFYPLRAQSILRLKRSRYWIILVYVISVLSTIPYCVIVKVSRCVDHDLNEVYEFESRFRKNSVTEKALLLYIRWLWPIASVFIPLVMLFFCNIKLVQGLRRATRMRQELSAQRRGGTQQLNVVNRRITLTLIIIVFMAITLLAPSELLRIVNPFKRWGKTGQIVASVANALQCCNFAVNFVLYCIMDRSFRETLCGLFCKKIWSRVYLHRAALPETSHLQPLTLNTVAPPFSRYRQTSMLSLQSQSLVRVRPCS